MYTYVRLCTRARVSSGSKRLRLSGAGVNIDLCVDVGDQIDHIMRGQPAGV